MIVTRKLYQEQANLVRQVRKDQENRLWDTAIRETILGNKANYFKVDGKDDVKLERRLGRSPFDFDDVTKEVFECTNTLVYDTLFVVIQRDSAADIYFEATDSASARDGPDVPCWNWSSFFKFAALVDHCNTPPKKDIHIDGENVTGEVLKIKVLVELVGRLLHQTQNGIRLVLGPTVVIPKPSATAVQAKIIRNKAFLTVGQTVRATEALAATHVARLFPQTREGEIARQKSVPCGDADSVFLRAVEGVPHVFGDELEWNIRPEACQELAKLCVNEGNLATMDGLANAREVKGAALNDYFAFLRGSAVVWHAHLRKCPDMSLSGLADPRKETWVDAMPSVTKNLRFEHLTETPTPTETPNNDTLVKDAGVMKAAEKSFKGDYFAADVVPHATDCAIGALNVASRPLRGLDPTLPQPVEATSEFRECFQAQDGRVLTTPQKQYSKDEFGYRLLQFARSMPDSYANGRFLRQRMAAGIIET
ncbi:hypothetical protein CYMTET_39146 [Cymbomonas tetramitiformis]|uniref:Uncharacterized protein n=1 Tax=Cymbomonas tetramitiformis TaxID=36881 RepID=A0AAE0CAN8_9CHLO|nr:hypothetical protein CYMTET_39146 [Cymbomonas tetramitiformis]